MKTAYFYPQENRESKAILDLDRSHEQQQQQQEYIIFSGMKKQIKLKILFRMQHPSKNGIHTKISSHIIRNFIPKSFELNVNVLEQNGCRCSLEHFLCCKD